VPNFRIPFYRHDLGQAELAEVARVLESDILTTGETVAEFERRFAALLGRRHALAVTSCTGALHLSLLALGIGAGDEVITTPMSFVATAAAIIEAGATPVFVDVEPDTGNIDASRIEAAITPKTRAIMPVHLYGLMCDMRAIAEIADRHDLAVIEDAAHCIEGRRDGLTPGAAAKTASFSFYATKNMTCGEGGALVTDDSALYERLKLWRLHGMTRSAAERASQNYAHWDMIQMGWKYNMSNIEAALLLPQFARLDAKLARRQALARRYRNGLAGLPGIVVPAERPDSVHAYHVLPIWVFDGPHRDQIIAELNRRGIGAVVNYNPIHLMTYFVERFGFRQGDFPIAERLGGAVLSLPFYPGMSNQEADEVIGAVAEIVTATASERGRAEASADARSAA
jgi:dTDP-4-amino-4,6-dideoxygalactose transaminase